MPSRPDTLKEYERALRRHRAVLDRILDRRSVVSLKRFYDRAQDSLTRKLSRLVTTGRGDTMSALQAQQLLRQVMEGQVAIAAQLAQQCQPIIRDVQAEGIQLMDQTITTLEAKFTGATITLPLEEAAVFEGIIDKRAPSLIRANESSFKRYGTVLTQKIEQELALSLAIGETPIEAIDRVQGVADLNWWQAERIVRTEMANAFNAAHADSIVEANRLLRDLGKRWSEHVSDTTGLPLDDRVAPDSMVLHGQVTTADGVFVMPPDERVSPKVWNKVYTHSPNRPNDRSVTMPWRVGWGIPGWQWRSGQKVPIQQDTRTLEDLRREARRLLGRE